MTDNKYDDFFKDCDVGQPIFDCGDDGDNMGAFRTMMRIRIWSSFRSIDVSGLTNDKRNLEK